MGAGNCEIQVSTVHSTIAKQSLSIWTKKRLYHTYCIADHNECALQVMALGILMPIINFTPLLKIFCTHLLFCSILHSKNMHWIWCYVMAGENMMMPEVTPSMTGQGNSWQSNRGIITPVTPSGSSLWMGHLSRETRLNLRILIEGYPFHDRCGTWLDLQW